MQSNIPEQVLPSEDLLTDLYLTERMERLYDETDNVTDQLLFSGTADDATAIHTAEETLSYGELRERVNKAAQYFIDEGVEEGERVLIQFANEPAFLVTNFALQKINAIPVPISPMNTDDDITYITEDSGATYAVTTEAHQEKYTELDVTVLTAPLPLDNVDAYEGFRGEPDDIALLMYSSGTTGKPKGTVKTHQELVADSAVMAGAFDLEPSDMISGTAPVSFAMGYLVFVLTPFQNGAAVSLLNIRDPAAIADHLSDNDITIVSAVPTSYNKILDATADTDLDFSSLRICMTGGEELKMHTYNRWKERFGLEIENHYGCTELMTIALYQHRDHIVPGTNGQPPEDLDVKLFDGDDEGELAVKGPVRVRYWNKEDVQREVVRDGYFLMGDIFERDEQGEYTFKCRKDNLIVTSGYKVSANEVENALLEHPHVEDAAVVGVPHEVRGNLIKAYVVAADELQDERGKGELQGYVKASIAPYKYPREVTFLDELPKTDVGKVDRNALIERDT